MKLRNSSESAASCFTNCNLVSMKKFIGRFGKRIRLKEKNKPKKDETVRGDGIPNEDDQRSKEIPPTIMPVVLFNENSVSRPAPELPIAVLPTENALSFPRNVTEDVIHVTVPVEECLVCNLTNQSGLEIVECRDTNAILPVDFVSRVDERFSALIPARDRQEIHRVVVETVRIRYPSYYDFCVIASDDDYSRADEFKILVSRAFSLTGCMLYDGFVALGSDLFECYESMIDHSTKVFFFITDKFNDDNFCRRLQNGTVFSSLMCRAKREREKCVPVFPNGPCRVPLALCGIAGIVPRNHDILHQSLSTTYTLSNKEELALRNQRNGELRAVMYVEQFQRQIEDRGLQLSALRDRIAQVEISVQPNEPAAHRNVLEASEIQSLSPPVFSHRESEPQLESKSSCLSSYVSLESTIPSNTVLQGKSTSCSESSNTVPETSSIHDENLTQSRDRTFRRKDLGSIRKRKKRTTKHCDVNSLGDVLGDLNRVIPSGSKSKCVNKSYDIKGGNVQVGDIINIHIYSQQTTSVGDCGNACSTDSEKLHKTFRSNETSVESDNSDDSSVEIDHSDNDPSSDFSDSADSDVDISEKVKQSYCK